MRAIEVRKATFEDLISCPGAGAGILQHAAVLLEATPSWSLWSRDDLVFVAGITSPWQGLGEAWALPGPACMGAISACRVMRDLLRVASYEHGFRRIQAQIDSTNAVNLRFALWMGFEEECRLADYGPQGQEYIMMRHRP